ncbi:MAG: hypothetical protein KKG76_03865 [Euryarchaeota archaeon]|nr:hypothetical protein [Euryarchaeota archaeon]
MAENKAIEKAAGKEVVKTEPSPLVKTGIMKTDIANISEKPKPAPEAAVKVAKPKEADPTKEFVDGIMGEMALKGASKKRLIKMLVEQYGMDKQKVMFRLKRALITERYAALHAEAGH